MAGLALAAGAVAGPVASAYADSPTDTAVRVPAAADKAAKMVTAQDVINLAMRQVGISENSYGGGTKFQQWYMNTQRAKETLARDGGGTPAIYLNAPWCAMFVSWLGDQLGIRPILGWDAYTVTYAKWFQNNGHWGDVAKPGAVVFYAWNGSKDVDSVDHVGIVVQDNGDGTIKTVEGNTGRGQVEVRIRPKSQVVGYGYPQYTA
ncbi:CHAP domain-containing protein [Microtetraspora sp. NBRC 13810]|uniref:CHAP domain-containing protein n=1 Tax=Microtetraspora sp. NBRC 13810 TaxID=3030990 RepID=UPI0025527D85|nr:CHAP domain-containing protein [Microtetraspora sp. NBRC 13810]